MNINIYIHICMYVYINIYIHKNHIKNKLTTMPVGSITLPSVCMHTSIYIPPFHQEQPPIININNKKLFQ